MRYALRAARRDIGVQLRSRGFLVGTIVSALLVVLMVVIPTLMDTESSYDVEVVSDQEMTSAIAAFAEGAGIEVDVSDGDGRSRDRLDGGDIDVIVDGDAILSDGEPDPELVALLQQTHEAVELRDRLADQGVSDEQAATLLSTRPLTVERVDSGGEHDGARQALGFTLLLAMLFLLMMTSVSVATGVIEEKGSRIVEILLVAVSPRQLLAGKLLAFGTLGVVQLAVFTVAGFGTAFAIGAADDLPPGTAGVMGAALVGYVFGFLFFGVLAAALASLTSRQEELNGALAPMTAVMTLSYVGAFAAMGDPDSTFSRVLTLIPPVSSMAMPIRMTSGTVAGWELVASIVLMLVAIAAMLALAARVYEGSVLRTGSRIPLPQAIKAAWKGVARS